MIKYLAENKLMLAIFMVLVPISCIFSIEFALSFNPIIDSIINKSYSDLYSGVIFCGCFAFFDIVSILLLKYVKENILKNIYISVKNDVLKNIVYMDISNFKEKNSGSFISILNNDIDIL